MPTPSHTIVCKHKRLIAPNVYELAFTKPHPFTFRPGQFVLFDVPLLAHPADIQPRSLSIASTTDEQELLFVMKMKPGGRASEWIMKTLVEGMPVRMQGPFGLFTITPDANMRYVFVATGTGIAPFRSQVQWLLGECMWQGALDLIFGVRSKQDLFWTEEFESLRDKHPNFHLHLTLTAPDPEWKGKTGRVQTLLPAVLTDPAGTILYICGAPAMVQNVKKYCLEQMKLDRKQVHGEGYI